MWWDFLLPVPAKVALLGLTFCQPILVNRVLVFLQERGDINIGYGLIGAYALVYIGLAVRSEDFFYLPSDKKLTKVIGYEGIIQLLHVAFHSQHSLQHGSCYLRQDNVNRPVVSR